MNELSKPADRRVNKTRMAIKTQFLLQLEEKPVQRISVSQLCQLTDINRSTFYDHYVDIYDLLESLKKEVLEEIDQLTEELLADPEAAPEEILRRIFSLIRRNRILLKYEFLVQRDWDYGAAVNQRVQKLFSGKILEDYPALREADPLEVESTLAFLSHGYYAIYARWLYHDCADTLEDMSRVAMKITDSCLSAF